MFELIKCNVFFPMGHHPLLGQSLLVIESSPSHSDTLQSVGLLCTSDQSVAETTILDNTQHSQESLSMPPAGFESALPALERLQTHALNRAATGMGKVHVIPF